MLTRIPPFTATNEMDLLIKVRDAKYRPISELQPGIPPELEAITDKCLTRSRANRYQTAAEAEGDLRAFLRKFMPNYSRSHLGRFIRKMFAHRDRARAAHARGVRDRRRGRATTSARTSSPRCSATRPSSRASARARRATPSPAARRPGTRPRRVGHTHGHGHISSVVESDIDTGVDTGVNTGVRTGVTTGVSAIYRQVREADPAPVVVPPAVGKRGDNHQAGDDIHEASTLILDDDNNHGGRIAAPPGLVPPNLAPAGPSPAGAPASPPLRRDELRREDLDDALHSAPTLILDHRRDRRRPPAAEQGAGTRASERSSSRTPSPRPAGTRSRSRPPRGGRTGSRRAC